ncbi:MAG: phosphatidylserine decarboxylase family protein [FCB group bacterium]|nr:phosphatidylserine decarboxylase family protein [FCB group bacterium]
MIAPEGRKILLTLFAVTFAFGIGGYYYSLDWLLWLFAISGILFLFCLNFFRDPVREIPDEKNCIISPADGKVVLIKEVNDKEVGSPAKQVSIFLNVFNVHVNRVPFDGTVRSVSYRPGKFLAAFNHKASDENEQTSIVLETTEGTIKVKQIAGLIARRILCYASEGKKFAQGDRLGFIMFGSRTDIIFPATVTVNIAVGDKVTGGKTIIGKFK